MDRVDMKKSLIILLAFCLLCAGAALPGIANGLDEIPVVFFDDLGHALTHVPLAEPTWNEAGHITHLYCPVCDTYYSDLDARNEVTQAQTVLAPMDADHDGSVTPADAAVYLMRDSRFDAAKTLQQTAAAR